MRIRTVLSWTVLAVIAVLVGAQGAAAQHHDHLKCYKIKDAANFVADADLEALESQFGDEACQIKGKGKLFCTPVDKTLTSFTDKTGSTPPTGYVGDALTDSKICYKVKCPKVDIAPEVVSDQFGMRSLEKFKTQLLCAPAVLGAPPTTTTTTLPPLPNCTGGSWPVCGGDCTSVGPTHLCEGQDDMSCACKLPCTDIDPMSGGFCVQGGGCPVDSECAEVTGVCTCVFAP